MQGGGRRNNCFIASDDNAAISINNRFITWEVIVLRALLFLIALPLYYYLLK